jgi:hypothetical protein
MVELTITNNPKLIMPTKTEKTKETLEQQTKILQNVKIPGNEIWDKPQQEVMNELVEAISDKISISSETEHSARLSLINLTTETVKKLTGQDLINFNNSINEILNKYQQI